MSLRSRIGNFTDYIFSSTDNHSDGASGRKLTAMWVMVLLITPADYYYVFKLDEQPDFITWLIIHFCAVGFFLGLITVQQIVELKTGRVIETSITKEIVKSTNIEVKKTNDEKEVL